MCRSFAGIEHPSGLANGYDDNGKRSAMMLRAVALPSRAGVIVNLMQRADDPRGPRSDRRLIWARRRTATTALPMSL